MYRLFVNIYRYYLNNDSLQVRGSKSRAHHEKAIINCQFSMAVFSTGERKRRPRGDKKSNDMAKHLQQTFEAAIMTHLYPRSQIDIFVEASRNGYEGVQSYVKTIKIVNLT